MLRSKIIKTLILIFILSINTGFSQNKKIAYCSDKEQITDISENCMKPQWSPDGKQLVFYTDRGYIYLIRNVDSIVSKMPFYAWNGSFPSFLTGDQIMFNDESDGVLSIMVIDTITYGAQPQLLSDGNYSNMQVVCKDGGKVIYSGFYNGSKCIMSADLNDTTDDYIRKISKNNEANLEPDVSNDGSKVVYASFNDNLQGTIRILENGSETALSRGLPSSNTPRLSPDGENIAFVVIDGDRVSLYSVSSNGGSPDNLSVKGGNVGTFQWMDNDRIIYDAGTESRLSVGIVNVSTGENEIIAEGGFNLQPSVQK